TVVVTGFGQHAFHGRGKCIPELFFPPFAYTLARHGVRLVFAPDRPFPNADCLIHIYSEEKEQNFGPWETDGPTFNHGRVGAILGNKKKTNAAFTAGDVPIPRLVAQHGAGKVFSN